MSGSRRVDACSHNTMLRCCVPERRPSVLGGLVIGLTIGLCLQIVVACRSQSESHTGPQGVEANSTSDSASATGATSSIHNAEWGALAVFDADFPEDVGLEGLAGQLIISDQCVMIQDDYYQRNITVVWPISQTSWNADTNTITFNGTELQSGISLILGVLGDDEPSDLAVPPHSSCPSRTAFVIEVEG